MEIRNKRMMMLRQHNNNNNNMTTNNKTGVLFFWRGKKHLQGGFGLQTRRTLIPIGLGIFELWLQKIIRSLTSGIWFNLPWCWIKLEKVLVHMFSYLKNRSHIPTSVTVVWSTEHSHHILFLNTQLQNNQYLFIFLLSYFMNMRININYKPGTS